MSCRRASATHFAQASEDEQSGVQRPVSRGSYSGQGLARAAGRNAIGHHDDGEPNIGIGGVGPRSKEQCGSGTRRVSRHYNLSVTLAQGSTVSIRQAIQWTACRRKSPAARSVSLPECNALREARCAESNTGTSLQLTKVLECTGVGRHITLPPSPRSLAQRSRTSRDDGTALIIALPTRGSTSAVRSRHVPRHHDEGRPLRR